MACFHDKWNVLEEKPLARLVHIPPSPLRVLKLTRPQHNSLLAGMQRKFSNHKLGNWLQGKQHDGSRRMGVFEPEDRSAPQSSCPRTLRNRQRCGQRAGFGLLARNARWLHTFFANVGLNSCDLLIFRLATSMRSLRL